MAVEHYNGQFDVFFMGKQKGSICADIDWDDAGHGTVSGVADMKMLKKIEYPIGKGSSAVKQEDGHIHVCTNLPSHFGNGDLKCVFDIASDGKITGRIPIKNDVVIAINGNRV